MPKKSNEKEFENPFSPEFLPKWEAWKHYKQELFKFKYKSFTSENAGLRRLFRLSGGDENIAAEIIEDCMAAQWEGLYLVKSNNYGTHFGTSGSNGGFGKKGTSEARTEALRNW